VRHTAADGIQGKKIDAFAAHPGTAKTAIWDKMDKEKVEGVAFDLTAKVLVTWPAVLQQAFDLTLNVRLIYSQHRLHHFCAVLAWHYYSQCACNSPVSVTPCMAVCLCMTIPDHT